MKQLYGYYIEVILFLCMWSNKKSAVNIAYLLTTWNKPFWVVHKSDKRFHWLMRKILLSHWWIQSPEASFKLKAAWCLQTNRSFNWLLVMFLPLLYVVSKKSILEVRKCHQYTWIVAGYSFNTLSCWGVSDMSNLALNLSNWSHIRVCTLDFFID